MGLNMRKPVQVSDHVGNQSAQLQRLVRMLKVYGASLYNVFYRKQILKALIRLHVCPGLCVPLLLACNKVRFSHFGTYIILIKFKFPFSNAD